MNFGSHTCSEILFKEVGRPTGFELSTGTNLAIGNSGLPGRYLSSMRAKTKGNRGNQAKINAGAIGLKYILDGKVNALESDVQIYVEFTNDKGEYFNATCDKNAVHFENRLPNSESDAVVPVLIFALSKGVGLTELQETVDSLIHDPSAENVFLFCDSLYYGLKSIKGTDTFNFDAYLNKDLVKQGIRTKNLQEMEALMDIPNKPDFRIGVTPKTKESEKAEENRQAKFEDCKFGGHILDYVWDLERTNDIQPLEFLETFVPNECFFTLVDIIEHELKQVEARLNKGIYGVNAIGDNYVNCQIVGRPGTGKTTIANALSAAFGMPIKAVINSKNTEEDAYQGMTKIVNGEATFVETPFLNAYKTGGIILLEEYNLADAGVTMGALGQAIERPFIIEEDGYKEVRRHPMCVIIATANVGTNGSREPSEAMISRMPNIFLLDDPKEEEFLQILKMKSGATKMECKKVYKIYKKVLDFLCSSSISADDIALGVTMRACIAALKQMKIGIDIKRAIYNTVIGAIAVKDIDLARKTYDSVVSPLV